MAGRSPRIDASARALAAAPDSEPAATGVTACATSNAMTADHPPRNIWISPSLPAFLAQPPRPVLHQNGPRDAATDRWERAARRSVPGKHRASLELVFPGPLATGCLVTGGPVTRRKVVALPDELEQLGVFAHDLHHVLLIG